MNIEEYLLKVVEQSPMIGLMLVILWYGRKDCMHLIAELRQDFNKLLEQFIENDKQNGK